MSKKDYLLQYAESAVQGLKLNADLERLEAETAALMHLIREKQSAGWSEEDGLIRTREILQLHARLRDLLQKKRHLVLFTDTKETRTQKVELLKTLSSSLRQASLEEEKQIAENRKQKEEALKYRTIKAQEVAESEKVVAAEVKVLQQKQDELEAQLKEVKAALAAALKRHLNIQEEKEKFDEASSGVIAHLGAQEEELARSITGQSIEADVLGTWSTFLEDTWDMQSSCTKEKDDDTLHALSGLKLQFLQTLDANLPYLQRELHLLLDELKSCSQSLKDLAERESIENEEEILNRRVTFETRFFEAEGQIISILRTADVLKEEMLSFTVVENRQTLDIEEKIAKAFSSIDQLRKEMEGIERPAKSNQEELKSQEASLKSKTPLQVAVPSSDKEAMQPEDFFEEEARREMLERGPNAENKGTENAYVGSQDETEGWDFDEIEEELKS
ncbi:hypothetical protein KP509_29G042200 [Ceratopteris richardii]|nr:hypothetical protein KP509_29G042200 [Ceratopteris richardii]